MKVAIKDYEFYFQMGKRAFLNGIRCEPCMDTVYMDGYNHQWNGANIRDEKSREANEAAEAWIGGWMVENFRT